MNFAPIRASLLTSFAISTTREIKLDALYLRVLLIFIYKACINFDNSCISGIWLTYLLVYYLWQTYSCIFISKRSHYLYRFTFKYSAVYPLHTHISVSRRYNNIKSELPHYFSIFSFESMGKLLQKQLHFTGNRFYFQAVRFVLAW